MIDFEKIIGNMAKFLDNDKSCIYFYNSRYFRGDMLRSRMKVLTDAFSKEMIWRERDTQYYSEGVTDPDYCVLKFTAISGRLYSNFRSEDFEII